MFIDDPTSLIEPVEAAWEDYIARGQEYVEQAEASVVEWRYSPDDDYLPDHPFSHLFDIGEQEAWRPRPMIFVKRDQGDWQVRHGYDSEGQLVITNRYLIVYGEGFHDILMIRGRRDRETLQFTEPASLFTPHFNTGPPEGRVKRLSTDETGRIIRCLQVIAENGQQYRTLAQFCWGDGGLEETFRQSFRCDTEPAWYLKDRSPEEIARLERQVTPTLRESLASRRRTEFTYDESGRLSKVADFDEHDSLKDVWYTYNPDDTIENVSDELVKLLTRHLNKAVSAAKEARPVRYVALQYSAEHSHCGLPTEVLLASESDAIDPVDWEAYPHQMEWPPGGRVGQKYWDLQRRLQLVVESSPEYTEDIQPRPYREVLWRASRAVYDALANKRWTTDDFAIFPLDDHGDVPPWDDIRESLPAEVVSRLIADGH